MTIPSVPFLDAIDDVSAGNVKILQSKFLATGKIAVVDQGQALVAGYTDDDTAEVKTSPPLIVFGDHTRAVKFVDFPFAMGADGVKVLRAKEGFESKYLYHYLLSRRLPSAGYSRHFKYLKEITVPKPVLSEQRRIAAILDHADALRSKRRQILAHLDDLTQSIFHDMFGDPAQNKPGFPTATIRSLAEKFSDGPFGSNLKSEHYVPDGVPVVRLQNIGVGVYLGHNRAFVSEEHYAKLAKHDCLPGDILIGTLGEPNLRACVQPDSLPRALNKADCIQFRPNRTIADTAWACWLLNMPGTLSLASSLAHGQTRTRISMGRLRELVVPVPPLALQHEFAQRAEVVAGQREAVQRAIAADDELFASLQSRAFRGEL